MLHHARVALIADTSKPGQLPADRFDAVAGYIGGDTPHVWSRHDWEKFKHWRKLPIYVRSQNVGDAGGRSDAFAALEACYNLNIPAGNYIAYDRETNFDTAATHAFNEVVGYFKYFPLPYGSKDNIFSHPAPNGWWVADYTGVPHMYDHPGVNVTQYTNGDAQGYDENEIRLWAFLDRVKKWDPRP